MARRCLGALIASLLIVEITFVAVAQQISPLALPDPLTTPGALNPAVTQTTIETTIWANGWSKSVRPPRAFTDALKREQLAAPRYAADRDPRDYEEDHLIPLSLGGSPTDPRNLWPEPWAEPWGAHDKDRLEDILHRAVCAGRVELEEAQHAIATDWIAAYRGFVDAQPAR